MINFLLKHDKIDITVLIMNLHTSIHLYIKFFWSVNENIDNFYFKLVLDYFLLISEKINNNYSLNLTKALMALINLIISTWMCSFILTVGCLKDEWANSHSSAKRVDSDKKKKKGTECL